MATAMTAPANGVGESIPPLTAHAVSVSLPTWSANVGYEEGQEWVVSKMKTGYPRFFIHKSIQALASDIAQKYGHISDNAILFPSKAVAQRCVDFILQQNPHLAPRQVRVLKLVPNPQMRKTEDLELVPPKFAAVLYPKEVFSSAKTFWQHTGDGVSSRRAEYCHEALKRGILVEEAKLQESERLCRGPRRYQRKVSIGQTEAPVRQSTPDGVELGQNGINEEADFTQYVEERFGRNLELSFATNAKLAIKRRIAGSLTANVELKDALNIEKDNARARNVSGFSEDNIYLYPTGMSAIFNAHRCFLAAKGAQKSINYGFPYIDTLKVLEKFGPGCLFYGHGSADDLDDLEKRLESGERYLALFCEFPGNPLLKSPDLLRIRTLADKYDFGVVIDETIGNFLNVHVLPYADVVVSSLTKVFSGDSNVMGGSAILNPNGRYYEALRQIWASDYEDNYWPEDAIFLERNSRDFVSRIDRINANAEAISDLLAAHPRIKNVNYPKSSPTRQFYELCKRPKGGYGGLLSATFYSTEDAISFYDNLDTAKGPSLGTNFTLTSPFVILAHYNELDWAASYGAESNLIRFSVGLEDTENLLATFRKALAAMPKSNAEPLT